MDEHVDQWCRRHAECHCAGLAESVLGRLLFDRHEPDHDRLDRGHRRRQHLPDCRCPSLEQQHHGPNKRHQLLHQRQHGRRHGCLQGLRHQLHRHGTESERQLLLQTLRGKLELLLFGCRHQCDDDRRSHADHRRCDQCDGYRIHQHLRHGIDCADFHHRG